MREATLEPAGESGREKAAAATVAGPPLSMAVLLFVRIENAAAFYGGGKHAKDDER